MDDCPICLTETGQKLITGCNHTFCRDCIQTWCCNHRAYCPMCEQPIYGLQPNGENEFFLSPHFGGFGVTLQGNRFFAEIQSIQPMSVSETVGLQRHAIVRINNECSLEGSISALRMSLREKRMARVIAVKAVRESNWWCTRIHEWCSRFRPELKTNNFLDDT